jgi:hypothetical protein
MLTHNRIRAVRPAVVETHLRRPFVAFAEAMSPAARRPKLAENRQMATRHSLSIEATCKLLKINKSGHAHSTLPAKCVAFAKRYFRRIESEL